MTGIAAYTPAYPGIRHFIVTATKQLIERTLPPGSFIRRTTLSLSPDSLIWPHLNTERHEPFQRLPKALAALGIVALLLLYFFRDALQLKLPIRNGHSG